MIRFLGCRCRIDLDTSCTTSICFVLRRQNVRCNYHFGSDRELHQRRKRPFQNRSSHYIYCTSANLPVLWLKPFRYCSQSWCLFWYFGSKMWTELGAFNNSKRRCFIISSAELTTCQRVAWPYFDIGLALLEARWGHPHERRSTNYFSQSSKLVINYHRTNLVPYIAEHPVWRNEFKILQLLSHIETAPELIFTNEDSNNHL